MGATANWGILLAPLDIAGDNFNWIWGDNRSRPFPPFASPPYLARLKSFLVYWRRKQIVYCRFKKVFFLSLVLTILVVAGHFTVEQTVLVFQVMVKVVQSCYVVPHPKFYCFLLIFCVFFLINFTLNSKLSYNVT